MPIRFLPSDPWSGWTTAITAASTTSTTLTWQNWVSDSTAGTSIYYSTDPAWNTWLRTSSAVGYGYGVRTAPVVLPPPAPLTVDQHIADLIRAADRRNEDRLFRLRLEADRQQRAIADARALELLQEHLTGQQQAQYQRSRAFEVIGCKSRKRYRIEHGSSGNVKQLDDKGQAVASFCIHADLPHGDNMLVQKLLLETDEDRFLQVANRMRLRG